MTPTKVNSNDNGMTICKFIATLEIVAAVVLLVVIIVLILIITMEINYTLVISTIPVS